MAKKTKFPKCTKVFLQGRTCDSDHKFLDIAPTMKNITYKDRTYFRCPDSSALDESDGQWGMLYLWDGWGKWMMQQLKAEKEGAPDA
jgi:hypothetical protein